MSIWQKETKVSRVIPDNFTGQAFIVWSGSQKVHPDVLLTHDEAIDWKAKVNDMGHHASIEILDYINGRIADKPW